MKDRFDHSSDARGKSRTVYGRRYGRPLRAARKALLEEMLPRMAIDRPEPGATLDAKSLFPRPVEDVWLEIGFGGGEHLATLAEANPAVGMIGSEYYMNGVAGLVRHCKLRGLDAVRIYPDDAWHIVAALPDGCIGRCFILHPDPWPKRRHHNRRIVRTDTLDALAQVMRLGAELRLATDHPDYLVWMLDVARAHPRFEWTARRADDWRIRPSDWPTTRYERKAIQNGDGSTYLRFLRV